MTVRSYPSVLALAGIMLLASGCASTSGESVETPPAATPAASAVSYGDMVTIGELPGQRLAKGQCGLFLFAGEPAPRFVFFMNASTGAAKIMINEQEVVLARTEVKGAAFDLTFEDQTFIAPALGLTIQTIVEPHASEAGGTRLKSATLKLSREDGWKMVMPVGGATSCISGDE